MPKGKARGKGLRKRKASPPPSKDDEIPVPTPSPPRSPSPPASPASPPSPPPATQEDLLEMSVPKKAKATALVLTDEQEQDIADWYRNQEFLYNFRLSDYKNREKKQRVLEEKAAEVGCTDKQLITWIKSMRDRAGKLTKPIPSGSGVIILTDRDKWIKDSFGYIQHFMKRVAEGKRKKGGQLEKLEKSLKKARREPTPSSSVMEDESYSEGGDVEDSRTSVEVHSDKTSGEASTASAVKELLKTASSVKDMMRSTIEDSNDHEMGAKRALADMIFHESKLMDPDTWQDFQAATLTMLMDYKPKQRIRARGYQPAWYPMSTSHHNSYQPKPYPFDVPMPPVMYPPPSTCPLPPQPTCPPPQSTSFQSMDTRPSFQAMRGNDYSLSQPTQPNTTVMRGNEFSLSQPTQPNTTVSTSAPSIIAQAFIESSPQEPTASQVTQSSTPNNSADSSFSSFLSTLRASPDDHNK